MKGNILYVVVGYFNTAQLDLNTVNLFFLKLQVSRVQFVICFYISGEWWSGSRLNLKSRYSLRNSKDPHNSSVNSQ